METTTQTALSLLLTGLGFEAMAREVLTENDTDRLRKYAAIVVKNSPPATKDRARALLDKLTYGAGVVLR
jgi:hypothetical protein